MVPSTVSLPRELAAFQHQLIQVMEPDEEIEEEEVGMGTDFEGFQSAIVTLISESSKPRHHGKGNTQENEDDNQNQVGTKSKIMVQVGQGLAHV